MTRAELRDQLSVSFEDMMRVNEINDEDFIASGYHAHECIMDWVIDLKEKWEKETKSSNYKGGGYQEGTGVFGENC